MGRTACGVSIMGFESATKGDTVFRDLTLARIIEPTSKVDAERMLIEVGVEPASYATVKRRLPSYAPTQLCPAAVAPSVGRRQRAPRRVGTGVAGALRRLDAVLRNRRW